MKIIDQSVKILRPTSVESAIEEQKLIEYAGRNCYRTHEKITEDSYDGFIKRLLAREHESPQEFADMTVEMVVGRDVMAEITRHRHASFAIQSQRYCRDNATGEIEFIRPSFWVDVKDFLDVKKWCASREWEKTCWDAEEAYDYQINDCSLKAQDARVVLPNSCATHIVMKANLREWLHIFALRTSKAAYPKMREVMLDLLSQAAPLYQAVLGDFNVQ